MMKWCAVQNCKSGSRAVSKCSMFRVPKDSVMLKKWQEAIPGIIKLNQTDVVCEKHFDENDISREWVKHDTTGRIIARARYKCPQLKKFAVPTKFNAVAKGMENSVSFHEYAMQFPNSCIIPMNDNCGNSSTNSKSILQESNISDQSHSFMKPSIQVISTLVETPEKDESISAAYFDYVPESWSIDHNSNAQYMYFSYSILKMGIPVPYPVIQKCVTLDAHGTLKFFVYGHCVEIPEEELVRVLKKKEMLPNILEKFKKMRVCSGLGDINIYLVSDGEAYKDYVDKWRSKDCSLLSKKKKCYSCIKSRRCIQQREARLRNQTTRKRIGRVLNPVDQRKVIAMQKKNSRQGK